MKLPQGFKKLIEENALSLATVNSRGEPHIVGVAFVKVREGKLIITNNYMQSTISNIRRSPMVALAVWDKKWKGYEILGHAEHHSSGGWYDFIKRLKENKGQPCRGALVITPTSLKKLA